MNPDHIQKLLNNPKVPKAEREALAARLNGQNQDTQPQPKPVRTNYTTYTPDLDEVVRSFWNVRRRELEERHPVAEAAYMDLLESMLGFGDDAAKNQALADRYLAVLSVCRSPWMKNQLGDALYWLQRLPHTGLDEATRAAIVTALVHELHNFQDDRLKHRISELQSHPGLV